MNQSAYIRTAVLLASLLAATPHAGAQQLDPSSVMDAYTVAINDHDLDAALALVADDAVYHRPNGAFVGKEEIKGFIDGLFARDVQVELVGERQVEGERVTWHSRVTLKGPDQIILNNSESVVRDGKIVMHTATRAQ